MDGMNTPKLIEFPSIGAPELGYISVAENPNLPFEVKRIYWTYHTPEGVVRGHHAHLQLEQILIAMAGTIHLDIETVSGEKFNFVLDHPSKGVYIPSMSWRTMKYSHNAVQICLASVEYDESDYIRDFNEFKEGRQS
jgi:hypothetical protein